MPIARRFYISGLVKRPGAYKLTAGMTVSQAIVLVGGLSDGGNDRRIRISRKVNGKSIEISVQMDDRILPDDEIKVQRRMF